MGSVICYAMQWDYKTTSAYRRVKNMSMKQIIPIVRVKDGTHVIQVITVLDKKKLFLGKVHVHYEFVNKYE